MAKTDSEFQLHRATTSFSLHILAVAATVSVLLFQRTETAARLDLLGALGGELTILVLVAVATARLSIGWRNRLPAGLILWLGAAMSAVGVGLMAWTIELTLFVVGGVLFAVGSAPALIIHRPILAATLATPSPEQDRFRTMAWYWASATFGLALPLGLRVLTDITEATLLWICFTLFVLAIIALTPNVLTHDDDTATETAARTLDTPWAKRSYWAAAGLGFVFIAGVDHASEVLVDEWQRSPRQTAAVLATAPLAGAAVSAFGSWYHRLHRLRGSQRADVVGIQLLVAGALATLGAFSFTYIGLIVCWALAGGAATVAVTGLDAAVFPAVHPDLRRRVAFRQLAYFVVGGAISLLVEVVLPSSAGEQWRLAVLGLPLVAMGLLIRRFADPARPPTETINAAGATRVPRRVLGLNDADNTADQPPSDEHDQAVPMLLVENLAVSYGTVQVLFDVDLQVKRGQVVALLGTNGAGKTTLLRAISGLEPTMSGRVLYSGLDVTKTRPTWRVGMGLHQIVGGNAIVGPLTVEENLELYARAAPAPGADRTATGNTATGSTVDSFDVAFDAFPRLAERRHQRAETLSGGERQMLALSRALLVRPQLLLIDEFSLGLAPVVISQLLPIVRRIAERGSSILLVEQSVNIALSVADYAYVMEKGEIGYHGPAAELRAKPDLVRSAYLQGLSQALAQ